MDRSYGASQGLSSGVSMHSVPSTAATKDLRYSDKVVISIATLLPVAFTLVATSEFTFAGRRFYLFLQQQENWYERSRFYIFSGVFLTFIGYLLDVHRWSGWNKSRKAWIAAALACFSVGWLMSTPDRPAAPIILGIVFEFACIATVRIFWLPDVVPEQFGRFLGLAKIAAGLTLLATWLIWVYHTAMWGRAAKLSWSAGGHSVHIGFILWSSPAILAVCLLVYGGFALLWSQIHVDAKTHELKVGVEFKVYLAVLMALGVMLWALTAVADCGIIGLTKTVKCFFAFMVISFGIYVSLRVPYEEFEELTKRDDNYVVSTLMETLHSDWIKGAAILFVGPAIPAYFAMEAIHAAIRRCLVHMGAEEGWTSEARESSAEAGDDGVMKGHSVDSFGASLGPTSLVQPARGLWYRMTSRWEWNSILSKAIMWGLVYWVVSVLTTNGCNLMLAWATEKVDGIPLWKVFTILWFVGMFMFLLPPVPGMPIYLCVGSVLVQRLQEMGYSFFYGCFVGIAFSFLIKMAATACEQKCIGEVFSKNISIRKMVGTHTLFMRGLAYILRQPGWRFDKVAILVGGPDWPTSVMTGILRLSVVDMLVCSIPVVFVIIPPVLAAAFKLRADQDPKDKAQWSSLATVFVMMTGMILGCASLAAGYSVQRVLQDPALKEQLMKREGMSEEDLKLDEAVEREVAKDEQKNEAISRRTCWKECPGWLAVLLVLGDLLMMTSVYIVLIPASFRDVLFGGTPFEGDPFQKFEQTDKLSSLQGGVWGLARKSGCLALALASLSCICLLVDAIWRSIVGRSVSSDDFDKEKGEEAPLLAKQDPPPSKVGASA